MGLEIGDLIGEKYRIVRVIGDGGMGTVYEARHELLKAPVALKTLHAELASRPGLSQRFLQEARVSATIQSPHVVRVTDYGKGPDGTPYLVMELLAGETLQAVMDRSDKLTPQQAIEFAIQILSGLEAAHDLGVVHRDLKPDNVLVTPSTGGSLLKLIDFGIAKLRESKEYKKGLTTTGAVMGTAEYMAPEQLYAASEVDHRADLYSLGVILFEMLSGTFPADADDVQAIVAKVVTGDVRRLDALEPDLERPLVDVVERALAADREHRFGSATAMRRALQALAEHAGAASGAGVTPVPALSAPPKSSVELSSIAPTSLSPPTPPTDSPPERSVPDTMDAPPQGGVERTWPPAAPMGDATTQPAPDPAPPALRPAPSPAARRRRQGGPAPWIALLLLLAAGAAIALVALAPGPSEPPALPDPLDPAPPGSTTSPVEPVEPLAPTGEPSPPASPPATPPRRPPATTGGAPTLPPPLTLPSLTLPTSLPPLPSTFPGLPTALPSTFPPIPGLGLPAGAPAAPPAGSSGG